MHRSGAEPEHLAVPEPVGVQVAGIGQVLVGLNPHALGGQGEGFRHAHIVAVDHHDVRAVADDLAAQDGRREAMAWPELVAADDDTHAGIACGWWTGDHKADGDILPNPKIALLWTLRCDGRNGKLVFCR
jgi:hypothetical protein